MNVRQALLSLCLSLTVLTEAVSAEPLAKETDAALDGLPAVACHFDSSVTRQGKDVPAQREEWYLWRESAQVETRDTTGETSEVWRRHQDGQIFYQLIFHEDALVINYTPAELQAAQHYPDWSDLTTMIDPHFLKTQFKKTGKVKILGRQAQRYQGKLNDVTLEVWWLEDEQIPALLRQVYTDGEVTLRLKALYPLDQSPWLRSQTEHYAKLDFIELDEKDPEQLVHSFQDQSAFPPAP